MLDTSVKKHYEKQAADMMDAIRRNWDSISNIRLCLAVGSYDAAREAWREIPEKDQMLIWKAPSKGGIFTTLERNLIRSGEVKDERRS